MTTHALWVICNCLALIVFINRYVAGIILRVVRRKTWDETTDEYEPTVTAVIPMFNEGAAIRETLQSLVDSSYPHAKLRIVCVDDCSTDDSYEHARAIAKKSRGRLTILRNRVNLGKRRSIIRATRESDSEIIVSVDSDVIVEKDAIRQLMRRFTDDRIAAVGGWVDVRNKQENWLTRMQVVKYWYAYFFMKNLEWGFRRVMCLSGCLTAYRRKVLVELEPVLEKRSILGVPIKYGEDRFLTHQIVKHGYRTVMTMSAMCFTKAPTNLKGYFNQQLRWKRSNIVDFIVGIGHAWDLHPLLCVQYLSMLLLLLVYPFVIVTHVLEGEFFHLTMMHLAVIAGFSMVYHFAPSTRALPPWMRVHPIWFLPMAVLMPVAYMLLTPLGLFTLDTSSWETRGHVAGVAPGPPPGPGGPR